MTKNLSNIKYLLKMYALEKRNFHVWTLRTFIGCSIKKVIKLGRFFGSFGSKMSNVNWNNFTSSDRNSFRLKLYEYLSEHQKHWPKFSKLSLYIGFVAILNTVWRLSIYIKYIILFQCLKLETSSNHWPQSDPRLHLIRQNVCWIVSKREDQTQKRGSKMHFGTNFNSRPSAKKRC